MHRNESAWLAWRLTAGNSRNCAVPGSQEMRAIQKPITRIVGQGVGGGEQNPSSTLVPTSSVKGQDSEQGRDELFKREQWIQVVKLMQRELARWATEALLVSCDKMNSR